MGLAAHEPGGSPDRVGRRRCPGLGAMRAAGASSSVGTCRTVSFLPQLQRQRLESDGYPERPVDPCILAMIRNPMMRRRPMTRTTTLEMQTNLFLRMSVCDLNLH